MDGLKRRLNSGQVYILAQDVPKLILTTLSKLSNGAIRPLWLCVMLSLFVCPRVAYSNKSSTFGTAQDAEQSLTANVVVKDEIKGGDTHSYTFSLQTGEYASIRLMRDGIDVVLSIRSSNDARPTRVENPAGPSSPMFASVMAQAGGKYTVEVKPVRKWLPKGRYEIELQKLAAPGERERKVLLAQLKTGEGRGQQLLGTPDSLKAAIAEYEQARMHWREAGDVFEEANTLQYIAQTHRDMRDWEKAQTYYEQALSLRTADPNARAYTLLDQADTYYLLKSRTESFQFYERAHQTFITNNDKRGQALALTQMALIKMGSLEWDTARKNLNTALDLNRSENDSYEEARVLNALGGVSDNQGQPETALEFYQLAKDAFHRLGDKAREGNMYNNIGVRYDTWGEWLAAVDSYNTAIDLLEASLTDGDTDRLFVNGKKASALYNLGSLYVSLGSYSEGLTYLLDSLALRAPQDRGPTLMWIGYTRLLMGDPQKALADCMQALHIQEPLNDPRRAQTYTVLGMVNEVLNDRQHALEYFNKALEIQARAKTPDLQGQSITLDKRGAFYASTGEIAKAREDFEAALKIWRMFKDTNGEAMTLFRLARLERDAGNIDAGLSIAQQAIKIIEPLRKNVAAQMRTSYFALKVDYYELYIDLLMRSRREGNFAERTTSAFEASELQRARSLLDSLSLTSVESATDPHLSRLIGQRRHYQRLIVAKTALRFQAILKSPAFNHEKADRELDNLAREQDKLEKEIRTKYPAYAALTSSDPLSAKDTQQQLDSDTLLLEFALGEKRSYAWAITNETIQGFELASREQIESVATRLRQAVMARNLQKTNESPVKRKARLDKADQESADAAAALSKLILGKVVPELRHKRLVVVADGVLQLIPFNLLPDPTTLNSGNVKPALLISKYEIVSLPSASVLALQRQELANRQPAPLTVAVVADPVFDRKDQRVAEALAAANKRSKEAKPQSESSRPATSPNKSPNAAVATTLRSVGADPNAALYRLIMSRVEAAEIARVVPANRLFKALDFQANRSTMMNGELAKYRYVHFATHGLIDLEHPELSGIVLSLVDEQGKEQDGFVRLYEIYNLDLPAELVVLSACETGVGKQVRGEGLMALTRGFMYAGAARVVASLWKVDDSATAALMGQFYKEMFTNGRKPAAALREAQKYMSEQKSWRSPYYWAGFVLQGEWR